MLPHSVTVSILRGSTVDAGTLKGSSGALEEGPADDMVTLRGSIDAAVLLLMSSGESPIANGRLYFTIQSYSDRATKQMHVYLHNLQIWQPTT